jgi:hypothetical protein
VRETSGGTFGVSLGFLVDLLDFLVCMTEMDDVGFYRDDEGRE